MVHTIIFHFLPNFSGLYICVFYECFQCLLSLKNTSFLRACHDLFRIERLFVSTALLNSWGFESTLCKDVFLSICLWIAKEEQNQLNRKKLSYLYLVRVWSSRKEIQWRKTLSADYFQYDSCPTFPMHRDYYFPQNTLSRLFVWLVVHIICMSSCHCMLMYL